MAHEDGDINKPISGFLIYEDHRNFSCRLAEEDGGKERWLIRLSGI